MKLYYAPGACSLAPHIVLREAGQSFDLEKVDLKTKQTASGADYAKINPKGYVPALQLEDGSIMTEVTALLQYAGDRAPAAGLVPMAQTPERYKLLEWLGFISTEIHKTYGPLFVPTATEETKEMARKLLTRRYDFLETTLAKQPYLMGEKFSAADAYLFTITNWARFVKFDLTPWPSLQRFQQRVAERPAVQEALKAEGLIK